MDKKKLSEADICEKFITPAIQGAGWNTIEQIYREPGRVVVRGKQPSRDKKSILRADYVLFFKANIPLVVIEAKDNNHSIGAGMAKAITYAELLNEPLSIFSKGDVHDMLGDKVPIESINCLGQRFETEGGGTFQRHIKIAAMAIRTEARA